MGVPGLIEFAKKYASHKFEYDVQDEIVIVDGASIANDMWKFCLAFGVVPDYFKFGYEVEKFVNRFRGAKEVVVFLDCVYDEDRIEKNLKRGKDRTKRFLRVADSLDAGKAPRPSDAIWPPWGMKETGKAFRDAGATVYACTKDADHTMAAYAIRYGSAYIFSNDSDFLMYPALKTRLVINKGGRFFVLSRESLLRALGLDSADDLPRAASVAGNDRHVHRQRIDLAVADNSLMTADRVSDYDIEDEIDNYLGDLDTPYEDVQRTKIVLSVPYLVPEKVNIELKLRIRSAVNFREGYGFNQECFWTDSNLVAHRRIVVPEPHEAVNVTVAELNKRSPLQIREYVLEVVEAMCPGYVSEHYAQAWKHQNNDWSRVVYLPSKHDVQMYSFLCEILSTVARKCASECEIDAVAFHRAIQVC